MDIGMLWLDDDKKRTIEEKVSQAAAYYLNKYGQTPNMCLVNEKMLTEEKQVGKIKVKPAHNVLVNYFWLGVNHN